MKPQMNSNAENQEEHIEYLKSELAMYLDRSPLRWEEQRGYIPTVTYPKQQGPGEWSEGVDYVVLDEFNIAYRESGDWRDDSDWYVYSPDEFVVEVIRDAESWLI